MKSFVRLLTALMLALAIIFNMAACDISSFIPGSEGSNDGTGNENGGENGAGGGSSNGGNSDNGGADNGGNTDGGTNGEDDYVFGEEYPCISITEAMLIAEEYVDSASTEKYYIVATVLEFVNSREGRMYISDGTSSLYVYRSTDINGASLSSSDLAVGDILIICGTLRNYKGTLEIEKGQVIDFYTPGVDTPTRPGGDNEDNDDDNTGNSGNNGNDSDSGNVGGDVIINGVDEQARAEFYGNSDPADSYEEAIQRSKSGIISGADRVPDDAPTISGYQPTQNGRFIRNNADYFADKNTYVVVNSRGYEVFRVYRGGGYITLEEVAAYVYAFGDVPANYVSSKKTSPQSSIWGEYLRLNHSPFSGDTERYPYEPELPNISGCGGYMDYYEIDIGTKGTDTGNGHEVDIYNDGYSIVRGAARIVYTHYDHDRDGVVESHEKYVFYTYNHYNDFQEYLNYYGGWGEMFGNITGGGTISSKYDYNPTPYVPVELLPLTSTSVAYVIYYYIPKDSLLAA